MYHRFNASYGHRYHKVIASASLAKLIIEAQFGNKPFTRKEYNAVAKETGAMSIESLRSNKFVIVSQIDTFEMKVKPYGHTEWAVNQNGDPIMKGWEYRQLPEAAKEALISMNDGKELEVKMITKNTIEAERYYYTTNWGKLDEYITNHKDAILKQSQRILEKAQKQVAIHTATLNYYSTL